MKMHSYSILALGLLAAILNARGDDFDGDGSDGYDSYGDMMDGMKEGGMPEMPGMGGMGGYDDYDGGYDDYGGGYGGGGGAPKEASPLETLEEVDNFLTDIDNEQAGIIGYFDEEADAESIKEFNDAASRHGNSYRFGIVTKKDVLEEKKYNGPSVYVYKSAKFFSEKYGEKKRARYPDSKVKSSSLERFIFDKALPMVGEYGYSTETMYENTKKPVLVVFGDYDHDRNAKQYTYLTNRVRRVAQKVGNKVAFTVANKKGNTQLMESFDMEGISSDVNAIGMGIFDNDQCYTVAGEASETKFSADNMEKFVQDFLSGAYEGKGKDKISGGGRDTPTSPMGDEEEEELAPEVFTLTGDNFESTVTNADADVMLEFYAPWCGHCKHLKPEYSEVAKHFAGDSEVVIAAMDATAHTPPSSFEISGYPTLIFQTKDKRRISYNGPREAQDMISWIEKNKSS